MIFGYLAAIFNIFSFLSKERELVLKLNIIALFLYIINLLTFNYLTAALISFIGLLITIFGILSNEKTRLKFIRISPALALFALIYVDDYSATSLLPLLGFMLATIAKMQTDILRIKYFFLASASCWLLTGVLTAEPSIYIYDIVGISALIFSIYSLSKHKLSRIKI